MKKIETSLLDCFILEPQRFGDERGYFESVTEDQLKELGFNRVFQVSNSLSGKGIIRGLHFQKDPYCQAKVVRCHRGGVIDVVVDIRKDSSTYGKHVAVELTEENHRQFFISKGFAHGFAVLSETAVFQYKCDEFYHPEADGGISILDDSLGIDWRITDKAILSEKDTKHPKLGDFDSPFDIKVNLYK